jgi:dimethylhistidine N-methyltransferase
MEIRSKKISAKAQAFKDELAKGLFKKPKSISSKFFYDKKGDELFQEIMNLDEYYLTKCEYNILQNQKEEIAKAIDNNEPFNLIELGAGDGSKTKVLIEHLLEKNSDFTYYPVDISSHILKSLTQDFKDAFPPLAIKSIHMEYFEALDHLATLNDRKNVVLFLGSNIGNFDHASLDGFFSSLAASCSSGDQLLIGVDLKKDPNIILKAYSDSEGITAAFNLNLLERANEELGANFNLDNFKHYASYNPENGEARSYLISLKEQDVYIAALDKHIHFLRSEYIHTEISKKYNLSELDKLADNYNFSVDEHFIDDNNYFVDSLWTLK